MKLFSLTIILLLFFVSINCKAQDEAVNTPEEVVPVRVIDKNSLGLGFGLDYGGLGGNLLIYPQKNIGFFGGVGYAFAGLGYNVGAKCRLISKRSFTDPFLTVMYGYNAAIAVENADQYNKMFYGPSIGFGLDIHSKKRSNYWTLAILVPFRKSEVDNYIDDLKDHHGVEFKNGLTPVMVTVGFRIPTNEFK